MRASVLTALFLAPVALVGCKKKDATDTAKAPAAPPIKVDTIAATEADAPALLTLTGMIAADQASEVTADTQGKVVAVMIERGQRVKMGDPVVRLDVQSAAASAREAQANLAAARAQRALADEECKRTQALLDKGAITRSEYDRQSTQCAAALQQVAAAEARTQMITKSVSDGLVRAPFDGLVDAKNVTVGEWVAPGKALFMLVDDDPLKIELSVPEKAVRAVQMKQQVTLLPVANPCWKYNATVTRIGAEVGRSRSLIVEATIDAKNPILIETSDCASPAAQAKADLVPGMFAEAQVSIGMEKHPVVPEDTVDKRGKTMHVFVAQKGELVDKIVQVGPAAEKGYYAVLKGLEPGEQVARKAKGNPAIVDGARIEGGGPPAAPAPAAPAPAAGSGSAATK